MLQSLLGMTLNYEMVERGTNKVLSRNLRSWRFDFSRKITTLLDGIPKWQVVKKKLLSFAVGCKATLVPQQKKIKNKIKMLQCLFHWCPPATRKLKNCTAHDPLNEPTTFPITLVFLTGRSDPHYFYSRASIEAGQASKQAGSFWRK